MECGQSWSFFSHSSSSSLDHSRVFRGGEFILTKRPPNTTVWRFDEWPLDNNGFKGTSRPPNLAFAKDSPGERKGALGSDCPQPPCSPRPVPLNVMTELRSSDTAERWLGAVTVVRLRGRLPENEETNRLPNLAFAGDPGWNECEGDSACREPCPARPT